MTDLTAAFWECAEPRHMWTAYGCCHLDPFRDLDAMIDQILYQIVTSPQDVAAKMTFSAVSELNRSIINLRSWLRQSAPHARVYFPCLPTEEYQK